MQPLRYSINLTLDGCLDHRVGNIDEEMHSRSEETIAAADALFFGRVVYQLMEDGWRKPAETGIQPDWMADWMMGFAQTIHRAKKYVVSDTLESVDWNAEIVRGADLVPTIKRLKAETGRGILTGGAMVPKQLAELGLIDEYEFIVQPTIAGHGPTLFAGLAKPLALTLVDRHLFRSGAVAMRYIPRS